MLLVACANVAALQLVQVDERRRRWRCGSRSGRGPARSARGLLAESLCSALLGGGLGVLGALAGVPLLVALSPREVPRLGEAALDTTTLAFALVVTLAAAAATALAPIVAGRQRSLREALQGGTRSVAAGGSRMRTALVAGEVALALVLLVGAGLLVRSFVALRDAPLGFEATHLLAFDAGASEKSYPDLAQQRRYVEELLSRESRHCPASSRPRRSRCGRSGERSGWTGRSRSRASRRRTPSAIRSSTSRRSRPTTSGRWASRSRKGAPSTSAIATASQAS